jgi:hypothetical protein
MRNFLRDCSFIGPAFPEPFVQFEMEAELSKADLFPATTGDVASLRRLFAPSAAILVIRRCCDSYGKNH